MIPPPDTMYEIAQRLRALRREKGISKPTLARLSGVGEKTLDSFENIPSRADAMKVRHLLAVLRALGASVADVLPSVAPPVPKPADVFKAEQEAWERGYREGSEDAHGEPLVAAGGRR